MSGTLIRSLACSLVLALAAPAAPAFADLDAGKVGSALAAAMAATGRASVTFDGATAAGDVVTLSGVKITTLRSGYTATVPALVMSGVAERADGGYTVARATFDGGTATVIGDTVTWQAGALEAGVIPSEAEVKSDAPISIFRQMSVAGVTISGPSLPAPITADKATATLGDAASPQTTFEGTATGVHLPTSLLSSTFIGALVAQLDYKEFVADVTIDAVHDSAANTFTLTSATLDAIGAGKITVSGKASGIAFKDLIDRDTSKAARANARFETATLRLDNLGFVDRLLDLQAAMLGYSRDDVRSAWVDGAFPIALSVVKNEAFRTQFLAEIDKFLKDPKSLTFVFTPPEPVPLGQVMRTAARSPAALPDLLTPTVEANQ
jgi:hypothetical protein